MSQPGSEQSAGHEDQRSASVSSLASRFEQLASASTSPKPRQPYYPPSSSKTGYSSLTASAPPSSGPPPVKRPKPVTARSFPLQEQAARLQLQVDNDRQASSETTSPTEATFSTSVRTSRGPLPTIPSPQESTQPVVAPSERLSEPVVSIDSQTEPSTKAPPPIPHATRPVAASMTAEVPPSFAYNLSPPQSSTSDTTAPRATSPKRSRTPPPIPASRRSRPGTPSTLPRDAPSHLAEEDRHSVLHATTHTVASGVSSLAAKFGHARPSKSYATSASSPFSEQTSPESKSPAGHPGHAFDPHSASRALQHVVAHGTSVHSSPSGSTPNSTLPTPLRPLSALGGSSPARTATPPPILPRFNKAPLEPTTSGISRSLEQNLAATSARPALPSRDRSNSVQSRDQPFHEAATSLAPPLPSRSVPDTAGRPRAATAMERGPARTHVNGAPRPQQRRDTVPIPSAELKGSETYIPPPPPVRNVQSVEARSAPPTASDKPLSTNGHRFARNVADGTLDSSSSGSEEELGDDKKVVTEMPDASFANRRPPTITPERRLSPKHSVNAFAFHGRYAISATTHLRIWDTWTGETTGIITLQGEHKIVAVEFVFVDTERGRDGRVAWVGSKDGNLFEVDIRSLCVLETKSSAHSGPISVIYRAAGNRVVTVCESGKVQVWSNDADPAACPTLSSTPRTYRLGDKHCLLRCFGEQLWSCHGPVRQSTISSQFSSSATRSPTIRVYDVTADGATSLTTRAMHALDNGCPVGSVMDGTMIPCEPNLVYLAHETGHISIWDKSALQCVDVVRVSPYAITALEGVNDMLWAGNREGTIYVYDTKHTPWKVAKAWKACDEPIIGLQVDLATMGTSDMLHVASYGRENLIMWDGLLEVDWLEHAMLKRETEFSTYRDIKVFICSWNIDSAKPADLQNDALSVNFLSDALHSSLAGVGSREEPPEVIVFGLQEVVDLENKKLTAKNMILGRKKADALFQDQVSHQYMRWHDRLVQAVRTAMPTDSPYYLLHAENLVGLQSLIFVKSSEKPNVSDAAKISVKTGMGGRYGNKGAILARFVIDDSSICFLNCHLAAGQRATRQRNKDLIDILENKAAFLHPSNALPGVYIGGNGQTVFEHEICFLSGDLNYRISLTRSIVSANIRSNNLKLLLEHDQLAKEMKTNQSFRLRSFREAEITFAPTYKFDPGTDSYDSSAKERIPAWCDRILYRVHEPSLKQEKIRAIDYRSWSATPSDHKPISGLYVVRVKKMDPEQHQKIWDEMAIAWKARARDILVDARRFHGVL